MQIRSFRTRIQLLVVAVLLGAFLPLALMTMMSFERAMYTVEEESARNALRLVMLNIASQYKSITYHKETAVEIRKRSLRQFGQFVYSTFDEYYNLYKSGRLSERDARERALKWARSLRFGNNDYFFIYDKSLTAISHPDPKIMGRHLADYRDPKGNYVLRDLYKASLVNGGDYTNYWWKRLDTVEPVPKIGYAIFYPRWQWMIGTGVYVDDIDAEASRETEAVIRGLGETFNNMKIAKTGYIFMFSGKNKFLIHPTLQGKDITALGIPDADALMVRLRSASANPDIPVEYMWDKPDHQGRFVYLKESYVAYFAPLDWYVATSVYQDEIQAPARALVLRQAAIMLIVLLASIGASYYMSARMAEPLLALSRQAEAVGAKSFSFSDDFQHTLKGIGLSREDELGRLSLVFLDMAEKVHAREMEMKSQIRELHIEIDETKKSKQVSEIVETDLFRDLESRIRDLKNEP